LFKETEDGIIPCSSYIYCGFKMGSAASFNKQQYHILYSMRDKLHGHIEEMKGRSFKWMGSPYNTLDKKYSDNAPKYHLCTYFRCLNTVTQSNSLYHATLPGEIG
jgi:hypothetical protein